MSEAPDLSGSYRSEVESLRARVAELEAKLAIERAAPAKPSTQWDVEDWSGKDEVALKSFVIGIIVVVIWAVLLLGSYVIGAHIPFSWPLERRAALGVVILAGVWCLAFVRRVPR